MSLATSLRKWAPGIINTEPQPAETQYLLETYVEYLDGLAGSLVPGSTLDFAWVAKSFTGGGFSIQLLTTETTLQHVFALGRCLFIQSAHI